MTCTAPGGGKARLCTGQSKSTSGGDVSILLFDEPAARSYAEIRVELEAAGRRLEDPDIRIAAICLAHDLTLVTGNVRHFERVPGLRVENWLE